MALATALGFSLVREGELSDINELKTKAETQAEIIKEKDLAIKNLRIELDQLKNKVSEQGNKQGIEKSNMKYLMSLPVDWTKPMDVKKVLISKLIIPSPINQAKTQIYKDKSNKEKLSKLIKGNPSDAIKLIQNGQYVEALILIGKLAGKSLQEN